MRKKFCGCWRQAVAFFSCALKYVKEKPKEFSVFFLEVFLGVFFLGVCFSVFFFLGVLKRSVLHASMAFLHASLANNHLPVYAH